MNVERSLLSRVLKEKDLRPLLEAKITTEFFEDEDHRAAFDFIIGYWTDYGNVPTPKVMREECDWRPLDAEEDTSYLLDRLREQRKKSILSQAIMAAGAAIGEDPDEAILHMQHALTQVGTEISALKDENLVATWRERLGYYRELENLPNGLRGIPTGFRTIDRATSGLQPEQLVTLIGPPKVGKSTCAMCIAIAAHDYGKRPLFIGFEMSNEEQEARYDAIIAGISHQRLITGKLKESEWDLLEKMLSLRKSLPEFILSADQTATSTLGGIAAKVEQYNPDLVIVDGAYMLTTPEINADPGSPQSLTYITRNMKRMAQRFRKPFLITTQVIESRFNRKKGLRATDIGYSSSFAQDSDVVIGVEPTDDDNVNRVRVVIARSGPKIFTDVRWDWDTGSFEEIYKSEEEDEEDKSIDSDAFS